MVAISKHSLKRYLRITTCCLLILVILVLVLEYTDSNREQSNLWINRAQSIDQLTKQQAQAWISLHGLLIDNQPNAKKPDAVVPRQPDHTFDPGHNPRRPDILWLDSSDIDALRSAHAQYVSQIATLPPVPYTKNTRGIVTTVPDSSLATLTVSLHMLRRTDSELPVEIFLASSSKYNTPYCRTAFPALNATCRYLSSIFEFGTTPRLSTYQYKIFAIVFSSFEDVMFLDSDSWPISSPDALFDSPPFTETGMVLWPDFWYPSESPYFFGIAGISMPELSKRAATESGQIMYSKPSHWQSLMLAMYYNFHGPKYYWPLLSQGSAGQGDKETFLWSACVMEEDSWIVVTPVTSIGKHDSNGVYTGRAMLQGDPRIDWVRERNQRRPRMLQVPNEMTHVKDLVVDRPRGMFVHANLPKLDPYTILDEFEDRSLPREPHVSLTRRWMDADQAMELFGFDVEARLWAAIEETVCMTLPGLWLREVQIGHAALGAAKQRDRIACQKVKDYRASLSGTH